MFSADKYVLDFIKENFVSLGIILGFLKILAQRSKNTLDDSILGFFGNILSARKPGNDQKI